MTAFDQIDVSRMGELQPKEYGQIAYDRLRSIMERIVRGERPMGVINLFTVLPTHVADPRKPVALWIANKANREWLYLLQQALEMLERSGLTELQGYTFIASYRETYSGGQHDPARGVVIITFWHETPDTTQRVFDPDDEPIGGAHT